MLGTNHRANPSVSKSSGCKCGCFSCCKQIYWVRILVLLLLKANLLGTNYGATPFESKSSGYKSWCQSFWIQIFWVRIMVLLLLQRNLLGWSSPRISIFLFCWVPGKYCTNRRIVHQSSGRYTNRRIVHQSGGRYTNMRIVHQSGGHYTNRRIAHEFGGIFSEIHIDPKWSKRILHQYADISHFSFDLWRILEQKEMLVLTALRGIGSARTVTLRWYVRLFCTEIVDVGAHLKLCHPPISAANCVFRTYWSFQVVVSASECCGLCVSDILMISTCVILLLVLQECVLRILIICNFTCKDTG